MANIKKISSFTVFQERGEKHTPLVRFDNDPFIWCLTHNGWQWSDIADFQDNSFFEKCPPQDCCVLFDSVTECMNHVINNPPEREDQPNDNVHT